MKKIAVLLTILILVSTSVLADDEGIKYSAGFKIWNSFLSEPTDQTGVTNNTTPDSTAGNLSFTARKSSYFLTASALLPTTYVYGSSYIRRHDQDIVAGYRLTDAISVLVGDKTVKRTANGSNTDENVNAKYLGTSAATYFMDHQFLYGTLLYGFKTGISSDYMANQNKFGFYSYELGYGYAMDKTTQLTLGYRYQSIYSNYTPTGAKVNNNVYGLIMGVNVNFN